LQDWAGKEWKFDASDNGDVDLQSWAVMGMYMPDNIGTFDVGGMTCKRVSSSHTSRD
ncbi:unnamed protein product, partial [Laminaria digitata]